MRPYDVHYRDEIWLYVYQLYLCKVCVCLCVCVYVCVCAHEISPQMILVGDYVRMRWTLITEFGSDDSVGY